LDKQGGDISKLQPSSRSVLLDRASKDYLVSTTALRNAKDIDDPELLSAVRTQALNASRVLDKIYGANKPAQVPPPAGAAAAPKISTGQQVTLKNGQKVTITKVRPDGTFDYK
jgi:hypothetical protein